MTDIDPSADIELTGANEHVTARIPLAGQVTGEWLGCYHRLARAAAVPVRAETEPDRAWIVVTVPAASSHVEIAEILDAARALIAEADTVARHAPPTAEAEASIRDWWFHLRKSPYHWPASRIEVVRTGIGAEKRWLLAAALVLAMVVLLLLPSRFSIGPNWIVPVIEALVLAAIFIAERRPGDRRPAVARGLSCALVFILVAEAVFITVRLVTDLVEGGPETNSASDLLSVGSGGLAVHDPRLHLPLLAARRRRS
ncbi:MAG: hypothetical protein ACRDN1_26685 [Trebonia sp.]